MSAQSLVRLGRIGYLNVLPLHYPLEHGIIPHDFAVVSGSPAQLNRLMAEGLLDISGNSCVEYARRPEDYLLVPDLAIGSRGPVMSVILLSTVPPEDLGGQTVVVSAQTHTSALLLRLLFSEFLRVVPEYRVDNATALLEQGRRPRGILAIGDEALRLRSHPDYPHVWDLGEAWRTWTGLPFVFGIWQVRRAAVAGKGPALRRACATLLAAKAWGRANMETIIPLACRGGLLGPERMREYFDGLVYDLGQEEQEGLRAFYGHLARIGLIPAAPELRFLD